MNDYCGRYTASWSPHSTVSHGRLTNCLITCRVFAFKESINLISGHVVLDTKPASRLNARGLWLLRWQKLHKGISLDTWNLTHIINSSEWGRISVNGTWDVISSYRYTRLLIRFPLFCKYLISIYYQKRKLASADLNAYLWWRQ